MKLPKGITIRNGSFAAYVTLENGKGVRQVVGQVGCITPVDASRERALLEKQIADGTFVPKRSAPKRIEPTSYTLTTLWESYRVDYINRGDRDLERLEIAWKRLKPTFEKTGTSDVSTNYITNYIASRRNDGVQNGTINRELALLKAMFHHGTRLTPPMVNRIPAFPTRLKEPRPREGFIGDREYAVLCRNAKPLWLRTLIAMAYTFGFRKSEALNLQCKHVDLLDRWLTLVETKNVESRKVKMTAEVFDLVCACMAGKKSEDYVLTRQDGKPGEPIADPRDDWYSLCVTSGLGRFEPAKRENGEDYNRYVGLNLHDFRRSAIRNMVRRGINEKICMKISGHRSRNIFDRYNLSDASDLESASLLIERGRQTQASVSGSGSKMASKTDTKTDTTSFTESPVSRNSLI